MMAQMRIGEVARRSGIRTSAIRFYERAGLLPVPLRINGHRHYDPAVLGKIRVVQIAQQAGFTVGEVRQLLHGFPTDTPASARWHHLATQKLEEVKILQSRVNTMQNMLEQALACQCSTLDDCALNAANADSNVQV